MAPPELLTLHRRRLDRDLATAIQLQDFDQLERLCTVSTFHLEHDHAGDQVGWVASILDWPITPTATPFGCDIYTIPQLDPDTFHIITGAWTAP